MMLVRSIVASCAPGARRPFVANPARHLLLAGLVLMAAASETLAQGRSES